jgi:phosphomannomutase / phosphoglucomutase
MGRIFTFLSVMAVIMLLIASSSVYWLLTTDIKQAYRNSTESVAKGVALSISAQIALLDITLEKIAQDPALITSIENGDSGQIRQITSHFANFIPGVMKLRLVLPGTTSPDQSEAPNMGYADLEMVRKTLSADQLPLIQGDEGPNRHLAMTRRVLNNGRPIGVLLASLNYDFLQKSISSAQLRGGRIALKQGELVLGSSGSEQSIDNDDRAQIPVANTNWAIEYWFPEKISLTELSLLIGILIISCLLVCLAFFVGYRRFSSIFFEDQKSVVKAFKDLMTGNLHGNYPVTINEMRVIISTAVQFKRVLDNEQSTPDIPPDDEYSLDSIFSDESIEMDFLSEDSGIELDEPDKKKVEIPEQYTETDAQSLSPPSLFEIADKASPVADDFAVIFRAYDIRGIVGKTLTNDIVYDIGRAIGSETLNFGQSTQVVIARDGRNSSPELSSALANGIMSTGLNVLDLGLVPTPVLYFVAHHITGRSGVMVTGSHNPANYNGLKVVINGETLADDKIQLLKKRIDDKNFISGETGTLETNTQFLNEYIGVITEDVHLGRPMVVAIDCGNGAAGELAPTLLKTLGCEVIELFCDIDGNFPNHHPDPSKPENLNDLIAAVKHYKADVGLAFDGDGDRLGVIDAQGKIIWPDRQMMLFAKDVISKKPGAEIIFDVKCSRNLATQIKEFGGRPLMWKTGHSLMKRKLKETGAPLAGEMSGHIFFNDRWFGFDDALYVAARLIEILSADSRPSNEVFADFPDSINTPELNIELKEGESVHFIDQLHKIADFPNGKITNIDGLRVDFPTGWGLVRASNTTPCLVLRFEADSKESLKSIQEQFKEFMRQIKPDITLPF